MTACAIENATVTCEPGRTGTHASLFNPVNDSRGATQVKLPSGSRTLRRSQRRVCRREFDVRDPRLEEFRAERQHVLGAIEVVARHFRAPEDEVTRCPQRLVIKRLVHETTTAAKRLQPVRRQLLERSGCQTTNPGDAVASAIHRVAQL
jgi:hypothetical protein